MKLIPLTQGFFAIVDDADYEWLSQWKWSYVSGYARRPIRMHRSILNAPEGMRVDHIDGNPLNNTRSNLRFATSTQNGHNMRKKHGTTSQYKGVTPVPSAKKRKWRALITINKKITHLGYFTSETDAAHAYDLAALKYFGNFARLNFPE